MGAGESRFWIHIEDQGQIRFEPSSSKSIQTRHLIPTKPAYQALVDQRRIGESITEHNRAFFDRRPDDLFYVIAAGRFEEEDLAVTVRFELRVEEKRPHRLSEPRSARLARDDGLVTEGPKPLVDQHHPARLASALAAFKRDEKTS